MNDRYVEITSKSWGARLVDSIKGVLFGLVLFLAAFPLLFWNEARAVRTAKSLQEGQSSVVPVKADTVDPSNENKLVHLSAEATTRETLQDNAFGVTAQALRLHRSVEVYQWVEQKKSETRKKIGGGEETVTTYEYEKQWKDELVKSSEFKQPAGHANPSAMPFPEHDVLARNATLGAFHLPDALIKRIPKLEPYPLDERAAAGLPPNLAGKTRMANGAFFIGADPAQPHIGDARVTFRVVAPQPLSVIAQQVGNSFKPYQAQAGDEIVLVEPGIKDAASMFKSAQEANATLTWILRLVGYLMMAFGLMLLLRPIVVVADFIPMIGNLAGFSATLFALVVAFPLSALVIAVSWLSVRPLLGIGLLVLTLLGFAATGALAVTAWKKRHRARAPG